MLNPRPAPSPGGLCVAADGDTPTFEFNASPYTTAAIAAAGHSYDLTPSENIELCVDHQMMGVGGDSAATQSVRPEYTVRPNGGKCNWTVRLTLLVGNAA